MRYAVRGKQIDYKTSVAGIREGGKMFFSLRRQIYIELGGSGVTSRRK
jgi:hypothetical protein